MPQNDMSAKPDDSKFLDAWRPLLDTVVEGIVVVDEYGHIRHINRHAANHLSILPEDARESISARYSARISLWTNVGYSLLWRKKTT